MAKQQKRRATRAVHIDGQTIRVSPTSDISPSIIKLMVEHQADLAERLGEDYYHGGGYPAELCKNKALAAALKAKGLIR